MGAWSHQPKDNDHSRDLFHQVSTAASNAVGKIYSRKAKHSHELWERLGVLQLTIEEMPAAVDGLQDVLKVAVRHDIPQLLGDEEWIADWKDPAATRRALRALEKKLEGILARM